MTTTNKMTLAERDAAIMAAIAECDELLEDPGKWRNFKAQSAIDQIRALMAQPVEPVRFEVVEESDEVKRMLSELPIEDAAEPAKIEPVRQNIPPMTDALLRMEEILEPKWRLWNGTNAFFAEAGAILADLKSKRATIADYEECLADHRRLVHELDVLMNGDGAAKQASLCDIVAQFPRWKAECEADSREAEWYRWLGHWDAAIAQQKGEKS